MTEGRGDAPPSPGLIRRLSAIVYDTLLLFAVLFLATIPVLLFTAGRPIPPNEPVYTGYLLLVSFIYFAWFWTHGGQTLGMRAWRIRLRGPQAGPVSWFQAAARFCYAIVSWLALGAGFLWVLWDRDRRAWHDNLSRTFLVLEPPRRP